MLWFKEFWVLSESEEAWSLVLAWSPLSQNGLTPNPWYFLKSIAGTNGRHTAVQIGGVLQYKLEVDCGVSLLQSLEASEAQRYKWGAHCGRNWRCTASTSSCTGWGFLDSPQFNHCLEPWSAPLQSHGPEIPRFNHFYVLFKSLVPRQGFSGPWFWGGADHGSRPWFCEGGDHAGTGDHASSDWNFWLRCRDLLDMFKV